MVSAGWGFRLAVATSLASALVYVYFHLEGTDSLAPAVSVFLPLALLTNLLVGQARLRAAEAEQRRVEADLSAELARSTLGTGDLRAALDSAGRRIAEVLGLSFAVLSLNDLPGDAQSDAVPLRDGPAPIGTLLIPAALPTDARRRVERILPSLESLLVATRDRQEINAALAESHAEVSALADQQAALRRVATLVARGAEPAEVYPAAVTELAGGLAVEHVTLIEYDGDDHCVVLAARDSRDTEALRVGERFRMDGDSLSRRIRSTGRPARIDDYAAADGAIAARLHDLRVRAGVGAPVLVDGEVRGAVLVGSVTSDPLPPECEARVGDFADLIATAIANAETRAELKASRTRIITAADHARRGFERDLHDGAQQRIVSLGLEVRALEASLPPEATPQRDAVTRVVTGLADLHHDLQELSRGIHPAILSRGGLGPAIKTLSRRSSVPVDLDLDVDRRLPEPVEVAAYYVVAEALTNTAKHARATQVTVEARIVDGALHLSVADDGVGGADSSAGSGLIGLKDRVEAVSGHLEVASAEGAGTTLTVKIPL
ncbi:GAF domain-containing sensor histidine kinase [Mycolicibacterium litorale]|uniref:GAF domain-containing sensor histidine kinase n=1 Tax=Mycolicibacterium litorale TaxID=758802 RepID=UPI003988E3F7